MKKIFAIAALLASQQVLAVDLLCRNLGGTRVVGDYYYLSLDVENERYEHWKVEVDTYGIALAVSDKNYGALVVKETDIYLYLDSVLQQLDRGSLKMFGAGLVKRCDIIEDLDEQLEKHRSLAEENRELNKKLRKI